METVATPVCLILRSLLMGARWARERRRLCLQQAAEDTDELGRLRAAHLRQQDIIEMQADQITGLQRRPQAANIRWPYSLAERRHSLWCAEYYGIARRQLPKRLGVARSTVWRWLRRAQGGVGLCGQRCRASVTRTSETLVRGLPDEERRFDAGLQHLVYCLL